MKSITFGQALVAAGLVGLTLPLTIGQTNILYISAAYTFEGGPSPVGPIVALAATLAVAIVILVTGVARMRSGEAEAPLTHRDLLVAIGLLGLLMAGAFSPTSLVFSIVTGWEERSWWTSVDTGPLALQFGAFVIPLVVIVRNLRGARQGPSAEGGGTTGLLTSLTVLTLVTTAATAPAGVIRPLPHLVFSGAWNVDGLGERYIVGLEVGMAPALVSLVLGALAIPLAALVLLRWKGSRFSCTGLLVIAAALLGGSAGIYGVTLLLLFGIPVAALYWSLARGQSSEDQPGRVNNGQLLAGVALICLAVTSSQTYLFASTFLYGSAQGLDPLPGPTAAIALAYAIGLTVLAVAIAKLRSGTDGDPDEAVWSR